VRSAGSSAGRKPVASRAKPGTGHIRSTLKKHEKWLLELVAEEPDLTLDEIRAVRHPGYTAGILIITASGPALGSWLAAAFVVIISLPFLLYRTIAEDRILQIELAGYRITPRESDGGSSPAFGESQTFTRESMLLTKPGRCHLRGEASEPCLKVARTARGLSSLLLSAADRTMLDACLDRHL
jgi:hypothetical protein